MLHITIILANDHETKEIIYHHFQQTFPIDEQRSKHDFLALNQKENCVLLAIYFGDNLIGYFVIWQLSSFWFLEYFEIFLEHRAKQYGNQAMKLLLENYPNMVLEIEPDVTPIQKKRLLFYQKLGFSVLSKDYLQPSYSNEKKELPLYLLVHLHQQETKSIISEIHLKVYGKRIDK